MRRAKVEISGNEKASYVRNTQHQRNETDPFEKTTWKDKKEKKQSISFEKRKKEKSPTAKTERIDWSEPILLHGANHIRNRRDGSSRAIYIWQ